MIIAISNHKGGVGKTTTAVNLASGLANKGHRTLIIDLDSQCSASYSLGVSKDDLEPPNRTIFEVLTVAASIPEATRDTGIKNLQIIPGSKQLVNLEIQLAQTDKGREHFLANPLIEIAKKYYDYVVLDCPPSLGYLTINALVASQAVIVPVQPHYLALEGLSDVIQSLDKARTAFNIKLPLLGILLCNCDYRTRSTREVIAVIRGHFKKQVFNTEIRINTRLAEAPSFGKSIFEYDKASTGAKNYKQLTEEVLRRVKKL